MPYPSEWRGRRFLEDSTFFAEYGDQEWGYFSIGDNTIDITPLTEKYFYGRGVDTEIKEGDFSFRAFASKRRSGWLPESIVGGQVSVKVAPDTEIVLTGLAKEETELLPPLEESKRQGQMYTISAKTEPAEGMKFEAEYGLGKSDTGDGEGDKSDDAYRIAAEIINNRFNFNGELSHSGTNFPGYWQGSDLANAYLSFDLSDDLSLWGSIAKRDWDNGGDLTLPYPSYRNNEVGFNFAAGDLGRGSIYQQWSSRKDANLSQWYELNDTTNFRLSRQFNDFSLSGFAAFGEHRDLLSGEDKDIQRYQLIFSAQPWNDAQLSGGYRRDVEDTSLGGARVDSDQVWLNADVSLSDSTKFKGSYNRSRSDNHFDVTWLQADLKHELPGGKIIQMLMQWRGGDLGRDLSIALKMVFPLKVTLPWLPKAGRIEGRIRSEEHTSELQSR